MSDSEKDIRRGHVLRQMARPEMPKRRYEASYWVLIILYVPIGLGPILLMFFGWIPFMLLLTFTFAVSSIIYTHLKDLKRDATKGKNYAESRTFVGNREVYEQLELDGVIETKAQPEDPYPFEKVTEDKQNIHKILTQLGEGTRVLGADEINDMIDAQIRAEVQEKLKNERSAGRSAGARKILVGLVKKIRRK